MMIRAGIDVGGTNTDVVILDRHYSLSTAKRATVKRDSY